MRSVPLARGERPDVRIADPGWDPQCVIVVEKWQPPCLTSNSDRSGTETGVADARIGIIATAVVAAVRSAQARTAN